jgi:murein DD-endopeptidase MepM/ murein hydrolase activator NlpD
MGTAAAFPGTSADTGQTAFSASSAFTTADLANRQAAADRANRAADRTDPAAQNAVDAGLWLLPLRGYTITPTFGGHATTAHLGVDLTAQEGLPFVAAHDGKVVLARYSGALGYTVIIETSNGTRIVYGHSSRLLVREGQNVQAGDVIGLVGSSGYAYGSELYYEVQRDGKSVDAMAFMLSKGVDLAKGTQAIDG